MLGALSRGKGLPAAIDELGKCAAEPGDCDLAIRGEGRQQIGPFALVAIKPPRLDQFRAGIFVAQLARAWAAGCFHSPPIAHDSLRCLYFTHFPSSVMTSRFAREGGRSPEEIYPYGCSTADAESDGRLVGREYRALFRSGG